MRIRITTMGLAILLSGLAGGCDSEADRRPIEVSIPSVGHVQTGEFEIRKPWRYDLYVGVEPVPTDEATCRAVIPMGVGGRKVELPADRPCKALAPPMGAIDWLLKKSGRVSASGSDPGRPWQWPNDYPKQPIYWRLVGLVLMRDPGPHYVLELNIQPSSVPAKAVRAHLLLLAAPADAAFGG
jgi:hypothetical protein